MARFIDYQPTEKDGLFRFRDEQGGERLLFGTAAASIKDTIDRDKQTAARAVGEGNMSADEWNGLSLYNQQAKAPDQGEDKRTAQASPEELVRAQYDRPPQQKGAHQPKTMWDIKGQGRALKPGETTSPLPDVPVANPEMGRGTAPGAEGQATPQPGIWRDKALADDGKGVIQEMVTPDGQVQTRVFYPPQAGTRGTRGGMMPAAMTVTGSQRQPDEGYFEMREDVTGDLQEATGEQARAVEQGAQSAAATMQQQNRDMLNAQMQEIYRQRAVETAYQQAGTALQDYTAKLNSFEIDPNRIYSGEGGKAREFRHRIASVFGAFGSTLAKSPNFVAERIRSMREEDIRAQEQDLLKLQGSRDNALRHFQTISGDLETAKHAVRKLQNDRYIVQLKREAAMAQTPQAKAAALKTVAELERENLDFEQKFKQETAGQISKSFRYQPGSAGSPARGPSARLLTSGEQKSYAGARKALGPDTGGGGGPAAGQRATAIGFKARLGALRQQLERQGEKDPDLMNKNMSETLLGKIVRAPANLIQEGAGYKMPAIFGGWSDEELRQHQDFLTTRQLALGIATQLTGSGAPQDAEAQRALEAMARANTYAEVGRWMAIVEDVATAGIDALGEVDEGPTQYTPGFNPMSGAPE